LWKCEVNVREYNTIDLVKDDTKKKTTLLFELFVPSSLKCKAIMYYSQPRCKLDFGH
jgi:hypothetical protein